MENRNAYMNVLFVLQEIGRSGDSFWLYAAILLLVTTALLLIAAGRRSRCERYGETADEDADIKGMDLNDRNDEDRNMADRNTDETGILTIIVDALGGLDNIYDLACSDTRLRVTVNDGAIVNRVRLKMSGALGVLAKRRQVQVFYDDRAECIYRELKGYIDSHRYVECEQEEAGYERVLKKVHVPVEGDVVRVSDIYCLQDVGDGGARFCVSCRVGFEWLS